MDLETSLSKLERERLKEVFAISVESWLNSGEESNIYLFRHNSQNHSISCQGFVLLSVTLTTMIEPRCTVGIAQAGTKMHDKNLAEEMMELRKVWTAVMMEKCRFKNEAVACPKPRRRHVRQSVMDNDLKLAAELSDILADKASPPFYAGSPPIRSGNPLIQDAYFQEQRVSESWEELFYSSIEKHCNRDDADRYVVEVIA
ncbi:hypothetical protein AAC387_Pa05g2369 [Persea americana]